MEDVIVLNFVIPTRIIAENTHSSTYCGINGCTIKTNLRCHFTLDYGSHISTQDFYMCKNHLKDLIDQANKNNSLLGYNGKMEGK